MKRFLSIAAVLAMVFALAVPAFAATPSIEYKAPTEWTATGVSDDEELVIKTANALTQEETDALVTEAGKDAKVIDILEVQLLKGGVEQQPEGDLVVAFTYTIEKGQKVLNVLSQKDDGSWEAVKDFEYKDGTLTVTFAHLCTVAFVIGDVTAPGGGGTESGGSGGTTGGGPGKPGSPQTGYNTAGWIAAAMALILCAGFCFMSARRKTNA